MKKYGRIKKIIMISKITLEIAISNLLNVTFWYAIILYIHFVLYISSVKICSYLQYKWRYKRLLVDWAIILSLYIAIIIDILETYGIINL